VSFTLQFYWHARDEKQLAQLISLPNVKLEGEAHLEREAVSGLVTNHGNVPVLAVKLTLVDPKTGQHILPVYYSDNYFSLLPGETHNFRIEFHGLTDKPRLDLTGWNVEPSSLAL
jgi:hypothetical protein